MVQSDGSIHPRAPRSGNQQGCSPMANAPLRAEVQAVTLLGLAYGFAFFDRAAMNFLAPFVAPALGLNNLEIGALGAGLSVSWAIAAYLVGHWSDRVGKRKPFLLAM